MKNMIYLMLISSLLPLNAADNKAKDSVDFSSIKDVLKQDGLEGAAKKKLSDQRVKRLKRLSKKRNLYDLPKTDEFWSFMSEYWLVKNAPVLKWDFKRPNYDLAKSFKEFLERLGLYEVKFKILMVNSPNIYHFALPSDSGEYIFLLSVPFMRTLDLSKTDISLLLFENFLRIKNGYFKDFVQDKNLKKVLGTNTYKTKKKLNLSPYLKKYDQIIYDKGFNFQQQYEVTKLMDKTLKADLKLWNSYYNLLKRIDNLVKTNVLYKEYNKVYRSPELQLGWLNPAQKTR